ncbi:MAG: rhomboid family intramembrane serine protease, partial [Thermoplasmatota archaeon]
MSQTIIVVNFVIFFLLMLTQPTLSFSTAQSTVFKELAFRPSYLEDVPQLYTLFTSLFVHANFLHILMNMIVFLLVGVPFEQRVGSTRFFALYVATGIIGALFFTVFDPIVSLNSEVLLVGASGAIFGILGSFAALYPRDQVVMPLPVFIVLFIRMPVIVATLVFAGIETLYVLSGVADGVAHLAHIGGLVSGVFLAVAIGKPPDITTQRLPLDSLAAIVTTDRQRELIERVRAADEPEVQEAWLSTLLRELECPECGGTLVHRNRIECRRCGWRP